MSEPCQGCGSEAVTHCARCADSAGQDRLDRLDASVRRDQAQRKAARLEAEVDRLSQIVDANAVDLLSMAQIQEDNRRLREEIDGLRWERDRWEADAREYLAAWHQQEAERHRRNNRISELMDEVRHLRAAALRAGVKL